MPPSRSSKAFVLEQQAFPKISLNRILYWYCLVLFWRSILFSILSIKSYASVDDSVLFPLCVVQSSASLCQKSSENSKVFFCTYSVVPSGIHASMNCFINFFAKSSANFSCLWHLQHVVKFLRSYPCEFLKVVVKIKVERFRVQFLIREELWRSLFQL